MTTKVPYSPPTSESIQRRQNDERGLRLLLTQRRLYNRAKRWQGTRWFGLVALGIGAPFVGLLAPELAVAVGAVTGVWLFLGRTALSLLETRAMVRAACVQEAFDQHVFFMPEVIVRSERPTPEEIALVSGPPSSLQAAAEKELLIDWYPVDTATPGITTIAIAQRANASYTHRLIRVTVWTWTIAAGLWISGLVVWALLLDISLANFLLGALFPVLPAILDVVEYVASTWKAARDRGDLARTIEDDLRAGQVTAQDLLVWQERLFDLRRSTPQVPNWLYRLTRDRNESAMHLVAEQLGSSRAPQ